MSQPGHRAERSAISLEDTLMAFHITVICNDPEVEAALAAALSPPAIAQSYSGRIRLELPEMIGDVSWLASAADVSPHSDLALLYNSPNTPLPLDQILPIFSHTRILLLTKREHRRGLGIPEGYVGPFFNYVIVPFDLEEVYLLIYRMLKTPRAGQG
jgi:hypothetical protein